MTPIITTPKALYVTVPEGAKNFEVHHAPKETWFDYYDPDEYVGFPIPMGRYEDPILASRMGEGVRIDDLLSLSSLLSSHNLKPETTVVIPIK